MNMSITKRKSIQNCNDSGHGGEGSPASDDCDRREKYWSIAVPLSSIAGGFLTFMIGGWGIFAGPLAILLLNRKRRRPSVDEIGFEAFNFNVTMALVNLILMIATVLTDGKAGALLMAGVFIGGGVWLVLNIRAALAVSRGERYRYPLSWRLINYRG